MCLASFCSGHITFSIDGSDSSVCRKDKGNMTKTVRKNAVREGGKETVYGTVYGMNLACRISNLLSSLRETAAPIGFSAFGCVRLLAKIFCRFSAGFRQDF